MTRASSEAPAPRTPAGEAREHGADEAGAETAGAADADLAARTRAYIEHARSLVELRLDELVPAADADPPSVHAAIRWSLFAPAKRLRPVLVCAAGETFGAPLGTLLRAACAFELIHTYSLVHDDLPAMDDDDLRRGRPTCHVKFGEATAVLAGDALQSLAFQTIAEDDALDPSLRVALVGELARASGTPGGMVAGQAHDLDAQARAGLTGDELERIHRRKTGALIRAAARAGALIAGATAAELDALTRYAAEIGLLFQITDDLLDVTASAQDLGKTPGKDARARKATYPSLYGLEAARARAHATYDQACSALDALDRDTFLLRGLAALILDRRA